MKRILISVFLALVMLLTLGGAVLAAKPGSDETNYNGNGAPSGPHWNINIIGHPNEITDPEWDGGNSSRIFVSRTGNTQFYIRGDNLPFEIKDHNGTDGTVGSGFGAEDAGIILPYEGGAYQVRIFVRLQGPMTSECHWKSEYFDGSSWITIGEFDLNRTTTKKFQCKTGKLLADGVQDILWTLSEKQDYRLCQMRIYMVEEE